MSACGEFLFEEIALMNLKKILICSGASAALLSSPIAFAGGPEPLSPACPVGVVPFMPFAYIGVSVGWAYSNWQNFIRSRPRPLRAVPRPAMPAPKRSPPGASRWRSSANRSRRPASAGRWSSRTSSTARRSRILTVRRRRRSRPR